MSISMDSLPRWDGAIASTVVPTADGVSRRGFLQRVAAVGAITLGLNVLEMIGGRTPAEAGRTCKTSNLTYRGNCAGANYSSSCKNGCARSSSVSNRTFCRYRRFNSRHRTCGETQTVNGYWFNYAIRTNQCYDGVSDGWKWYGTDSGSKCGCADGVKFSCNDGYYKNHPEASYSPSICHRKKCR